MTYPGNNIQGPDTAETCPPQLKAGSGQIIENNT